MYRIRASLAAALVLALALAAPVTAGCGGSDNPDDKRPVFGNPDPGDAREQAAEAAEVPGPPVSATRNTTRIAGDNAPDLTAAVARASFPGRHDDERPRAVTLVEDGAWWAALPAAQLMAPPLRAPLLIGGRERLTAAARDALAALDPTGARELDDAQVIRAGTDGPAGGRPTRDLTAANPFALAAAIDQLQSTASGRTSRAVVIAPIEQPAVAIAGAGWAARSGDALLWTRRKELPRATRVAVARRGGRADIYVLGSSDLVDADVAQALAELGRVTRIEGEDAIEVSVALARRRGGVGWGAVGPGHGLVLTTREHPVSGGAAAVLSASAGSGPLLVLEDEDDVANPIREYLLDIRPAAPERGAKIPGLYNRAWLIGDEDAISLDTQAEIDSLLDPDADDPP